MKSLKKIYIFLNSFQYSIIINVYLQAKCFDLVQIWFVNTIISISRNVVWVIFHKML